MQFEWDEAKSEKSRRERGLGFDSVTVVFEGPTLEWCDIRQEWGEARVVAVGLVDGIVLAVVYTDRADVRRILSARRARRKERELWQWSVKP